MIINNDTIEYIKEQYVHGYLNSDDLEELRVEIMNRTNSFVRFIGIEVNIYPSAIAIVFSLSTAKICLAMTAADLDLFLFNDSYALYKIERCVIQILKAVYFK